MSDTYENALNAVASTRMTSFSLQQWIAFYLVVNELGFIQKVFLIVANSNEFVDYLQSIG